MVGHQGLKREDCRQWSGVSLAFSQWTVICFLLFSFFFLLSLCLLFSHKPTYALNQT